MEERKITISIAQARNWFNSGNKQLQELALQVFDREELTFRHIVTFKDACEVLGSTDKIIRTFSRSTSAMFKLNIIRKALNLGQDLHLTKNPENSHIYYPYNPFVTKSSTYYKSEIDSGKMEVIGKIKSEGEEYNVLGGYAFYGSLAGLGGFNSNLGIGVTDADIGFLGCATKEIAEHFGKYFGILITEAKYGDMVEFEIIEAIRYD